MKRPTTKTTFIVMGVLVLGLSGLNIYQFSRPRPTPLSRASQEVKIDESDKFAVPNIIEDQKQPEGTLTPSQLADRRADYSGEEVRVRGVISGNSKDGYVVADQKGERRVGFKVEASEAIDFEKYVIKPPTPGQAAQEVKPVTVVGIFQATPPAATAEKVDVPAFIKVSSINE